MYDGYYDRQIEREEKRKRACALGMDTCVAFLNISNDRYKEKIKDRVNKVRQAEFSKVSKDKNKLFNELDKIKNKGYVSMLSVQSFIEKKQSSYRLSLDDRDISSMARNISQDPRNTLIQYTNEYISAKREIERLKKDKLDEQKQQAERKRKELEDNNRTVNNNRDYVNPTYSYHSYDSYDTPSRKPIPFSATTNEEQKRLVEAKIEKEINNKYGPEGFSYDEQQRIKEIYPELSNYSGYYSIKTLEQGIEINNICNKNDIKTEDIMNLGLLTFNVVKNELIDGHRTVQPELYGKLKMNSNLEKYKEAYNKYMNYYKSLSDSQKENIKNLISNRSNYVEAFGKNIVSPDQLKGKINQYVSEYIARNSRDFYGQDYYDNNFYSKTLKATKYMEIEDIVSLYKRLRYEMDNYTIYGRNEAETIQMQESNREMKARLQEDFARVINTKLGEYNKNNNILNMTDNEKEKYFEEERKRIVGICLDILQEQPLASHLQKVDNENNLKGKGENIKSTYDVKKATHARIRGLSKVKKAFAQVSGEWGLYTMLMDKEELNEKEKDQLGKMFR